MPCPAGGVFPGEILQYALRSHKTQEGNLHPASLENNYLGPKENKNKKAGYQFPKQKNLSDMKMNCEAWWWLHRALSITSGPGLLF